MDQHSSRSRTNSKSRSPKRRNDYNRKNSSSNSRSRSRSMDRRPKDMPSAKYNNYNQNNNNNYMGNNGNKRGGKMQKSPSRSPPRKAKSYNTQKPKYLLPQLDGPLVTFRQFMEHQPDKVDKDKAEKYYKQYKEEWEQKQNQIFYLEHKDEAWFQEKYDPVLCETYKEEKNEEARKNAENFFQNLKSGHYNDIALEYEKEKLQEMKAEEQGDLQLLEQENPNHEQAYLKLDHDLTVTPFFGFDQDINTLFIRNIPKTLSRWQLKEKLEKLPGFQSLSVSDPSKVSDYSRFGWVYFSDTESTNKALVKISQLLIDDTNFIVLKSQTGKKAIKISPRIDTKKAIQVTKDLIEALDMEKNIKQNPILEEEDEEQNSNNNKDEEDVEKQENDEENQQQQENSIKNILKSKRLDIQILYLRKIHSLCYLCAVQFNDERMLASKCSIQHLRIKAPEGEEDDDEVDMNFPTWQTKVIEFAEKKIAEIKETFSDPEALELQKSENQIKSYLGKKIEKKSTNNTILPCTTCDKKFKAIKFVLKHIEIKHEEIYAEECTKIREEITLENYCKDKFKITNPGVHMKQGGKPMMGYQGNGGQKPYIKKPYNQYSNNNYNNMNNLNHTNNFNNNRGQQQRKPYQYKDLDAPEAGAQESVNTAALINYNDI